MNFYSYLSNNQSCVLVQNKTIIYESYENSVKPLVRYIHSHGKLNDQTILIDKLIGVAIANVVIYSNIKTVYTNIISKPALELLNLHNITVNYKTIVDNILRRDRTDLCPMEKKMIGCDNPTEVYHMLVEIVIHNNPIHLQ